MSTATTSRATESNTCATANGSVAVKGMLQQSPLPLAPRHPPVNVRMANANVFVRLYNNRMQALRMSRKQCRMVLCTFYIDAFEHQRTRNASVVGVYMSFANASKEECLAAHHRYLLCLVPKHMDVFEAIRAIIIRPMRLLERGFPVHPPYPLSAAIPWCTDGTSVPNRCIFVV